MSIGEKIVEARRAKNLTQEQLAELLGVTRQSISRWEQNQAYPEMEKILRLSDILEVSCDYLLKENVTKKDYTTVNKGKSFMQTRLLKGMMGKKVKIDLLDGEIDVDYFDKVCEILGFEEDFMTQDVPFKSIDYKKYQNELETEKKNFFCGISYFGFLFFI